MYVGVHDIIWPFTFNRYLLLSMFSALLAPSYQQHLLMFPCPPNKLQSNPSIPPILEWRKSGGIPKTAVLGVIYNIYMTLGNGRRYWGEAVLGGAVLRGTIVLLVSCKQIQLR